MSALHDLAMAVGLQRDWEDAAGTAQRVADPVLAAILDRLGYPAGTEAQIAESRAKLAAMAEPHFITADVAKPVLLPRGWADCRAAELQLEGGDRRIVSLIATPSGPVIQAIDRPGYHRLICGSRRIELAVAPHRCFDLGDAVGDRRIWGPAVQIPSLRGQRDAPFGDLATLAESARAFSAKGADAMAISPAHALFPADPQRFSPYAPSSREFLNVWLGDPARAGLPADDAAGPDLIDWPDAASRRMAHLRKAFDRRGDALRRIVADYRAAGGQALENHARFDALHAHFFARTGAHGWQGWPADYHDPTGAAVHRFAEEYAEEVEFHAFLQWLAADSMAAAQAAARDAGMGLGLIADLAVGMDGGGSHGWSRRGDLLHGLSIGAPPDLLGPDGQNWGITGFSPDALRATGFAPFIATLRAVMRQAGGIRIDHALGLRRLWIVPHGAGAAEGAYLSMPMADLFRLLALESHRARAIVIGEDLGTVPDGFRDVMAMRGMPGMRVLWFERDDHGGFIPPHRWQADAVAMTGTHDLATVAGWWAGRDIDWNLRLGRGSAEANEAADRRHRAVERDALWLAACDADIADGAPPPPDEPQAAVDAALAYVAKTPCRLALVPLEDIAGLVEQPNLPGTIDSHPNWRRRMPAATADLLESPPVARRVGALDSERRS